MGIPALVRDWQQERGDSIEEFGNEHNRTDFNYLHPRPSERQCDFVTDPLVDE